MVRQGWLSPVRLPQGRGYTLTTKVARRLDEAGRRIYRDAPDAWDGRWHLLVIQHIPDRARRDRSRAGPGHLGHAVLDDVDQPSRLGRAGRPVRGRGRARGAVRPRRRRPWSHRGRRRLPWSLPATLPPDDRPGTGAARFFDEEAARLLPAASRFVDRCLDGR
jgi:phenylacetic acid degradation operon negative regulatory protein